MLVGFGISGKREAVKRKIKMKNITYQVFEALPVVMMVPDMANVLGIGLTKAYEVSKEMFPLCA